MESSISACRHRLEPRPSGRQASPPPCRVNVSQETGHGVPRPGRRRRRALTASQGDKRPHVDVEHKQRSGYRAPAAAAADGGERPNTCGVTAGVLEAAPVGAGPPSGRRHAGGSTAAILTGMSGNRRAPPPLPEGGWRAPSPMIRTSTVNPAT